MKNMKNMNHVSNINNIKNWINSKHSVLKTLNEWMVNMNGDEEYC